MFLIYGCGFLKTYETVVQLEDGTRVPVTNIDREETLRVNASCYTDI